MEAWRRHIVSPVKFCCFRGRHRQHNPGIRTPHSRHRSIAVLTRLETASLQSIASNLSHCPPSPLAVLEDQGIAPRVLVFFFIAGQLSLGLRFGPSLEKKAPHSWVTLAGILNSFSCGEKKYCSYAQVCAWVPVHEYMCTCMCHISMYINMHRHACRHTKKGITIKRPFTFPKVASHICTKSGI